MAENNILDEEDPMQAKSETRRWVRDRERETPEQSRVCDAVLVVRSGLSRIERRHDLAQHKQSVLDMMNMRRALDVISANACLLPPRKSIFRRAWVWLAGGGA